MAKASSIENLRVKRYKDKAIAELDLMSEAIESSNYKKAMYHKIVANLAIDEMVNVSKMTEKTE